jgi:hypothetical protein
MNIKKRSIQLPMTTGREITKSKPAAEEDCEVPVMMDEMFSTFAAIGEQLQVSDSSFASTFNSNEGEEL